MAAKKKPEKTGRLSEDFKLIQKIIKRLIDSKEINYAREVAMLKKLLNLFEDKKFWLHYTPKKPIPSFTYLLSEWGQQDLRNQFNMFYAENKVVEPPPELSEEKVGEDLVIVKKRKTLSELLAD